jgi:hypothetical protein
MAFRALKSLDPFMRSFYAAMFLAVLPLGGCCLFESGCNAPVAAARADWDGLNQPAVEEAQSVAPRQRISSRVKSQGQHTKSQDNLAAGDSWQEEEARQQSDDLRLKRKLIICQGCAVPGN